MRLGYQGSTGSPWSLTITTGESGNFPSNIGRDGASIEEGGAACVAILPAIFISAVGSPCSQSRGGWQGSLTIAVGD